MATHHDSLGSLKDHVWALAAQSLDQGDTEVYRVLVDFTERLANLLKAREATKMGNSASPGWQTGLMTVFSPDGKHQSQFDLRRYHGRASKCVLQNGQWQSLSRAGSAITGYPVRGPMSWRYWKDSELKPVREFIAA